MPILVTGATGLVGNNVVRHLLALGRSVRVLVRKEADPRPLAGLAVETAYGDIRDSTSVEQACEGVSAVIHSAAYLHIGRDRLELQREINVTGTRNVARAARNAQARLLHISTVNALDVSPDGVPLDEVTPGAPNADCGYVLTKRESEAAVRELIADGLDAVIVNPGLMLGAWDWKPSSGRMFVEVVRKRPLFAPRGGLSAGDVEDVAQAVVAALDRAPTGRQYILGGHNVTYLELWRRMAQFAGSRPPIGRVGPVVGWMAGKVGDLLGRLQGEEGDLNSAGVQMSNLYHYYDSRRAISELGYRIRPLEESLQRAYSWLVAQQLL